MGEVSTDSGLPAERILGLEIGGRALARATAGVLAVAVAALHISPRASPVYLGICGLMALLLIVRDGARPGALASSDPLVAAAGVFAVYAAVSAAWGVAPADALELSAAFALAILLAAVVAGWILRAEGERLARLGLALLIGFAIGLGYLAFELSSGQALKRLLFNTLEAARPDSTKNVRIRDGLVVYIHPNTLNRNVAVLALCAWPVLLVAGLWPGRRVRQALVAGICAGVPMVVLLSDHESSKLALAVSLAVFGLHRLSSLWTWRLLKGAWTVAVLGMVPLALLAAHLELDKASWIQRTGQARIVLWGETAKRTFAAPLVGIGAGSTKVLDEEAKAETPPTPGNRLAGRTGRHAHNIFLQTWYELGALGALLLLVTGLIAAARLERLSERARPYGAALFATAMAIGGLSWGLWQPWLAPAFLFAALALVIGERVATRDALSFFRS